jgi:long-chain acyl-CoA synthetase
MTIRRILEDAAAKFPSAPALRFFRDGSWQCRTYSELANSVKDVAEAFHEEKWKSAFPHVAIMLDNCPEWPEIYLAMTGSRYSVVPMDPKLRAAEVSYLLNASQAFALFTDSRHMELLRPLLPNLPSLQAICLVDGGAAEQPPAGGCRFLDYEALRKPRDSAPWYESQGPSPQDIASIIYTSGTTGKPKGALLTHLNFTSCAFGCFDGIGESVSERDDFLIVLPFFHAFAFTTNLVVPIAKGACMSFVQNLRTVGDDIKTLRPTVVMAVPLLAEKVFEKIQSKLKRNGLAQFLLAVGLGRIVGSQVRKGLGGRLRFLIVGGAPCPISVLRGFWRLGIPLLEGYGLTECSPVVSIAGIHAAHIGTIGKKLPNIEVRIADPNEQGVGELQVRGPIVMKGYFQDIASTREAFDGEWLRTGDLAVMDSDGYLAIRGRKKALIVNREGKNIYPEEVERVISRDPLLSDIVVIGYTIGSEPGEHVGAIIAPDKDILAELCGGKELPWEKVEQLVIKRMRARCHDLADYKHPRKVVVQREPLERTSVQKVRRCAYQGKLDEAAEAPVSA